MNALIQEVLDDKAQDSALRNKVRAAVEGVDPADVSKSSYAHWLGTIFPRIRDIDFDYYTYENTKLTLSYLNRARLNLPPADPSLRGKVLVNTQPRGAKVSTTDSLPVASSRPKSTKPATQSVPPPDTSDQADDVDVTLPDLPAPSARPDLQAKPGTSYQPDIPAPSATHDLPHKPGISYQPEPSTSAEPLQQRDSQIPDGNFPTTLNYAHQVYSNVHSSIPRYGNILAVRGTVSPQHFQAEDSSEPQAPTYSELTTVRLEQIEPTHAELWNTVGPPPPEAIPQDTPETPLYERLNRIVRECQEVALDLTPSPRKAPIDRTPLQDEPEDPRQ